MTRLASVLLFTALAVCACADAPPPRGSVGHFGATRIAAARAPFEVEPTRHETFQGAFRFEAGARMRFASFSIGPHEELRLQRCGEQCATAKLVHAWSRADFQESQPQGNHIAIGSDRPLWSRLCPMIFLAITPKGLSDALASAGEGDHVWCGREAVTADDRDEMTKKSVTIFSYAFTGLNAHEELEGAVSTMEDHHPGQTVWVERISSE